MVFSLTELAARLGVEAPVAAVSVEGINSPECAGPSELTFISRRAYLPALEHSRAGAVLLPMALQGQVATKIPTLWVEDAYLAYARLSALFASKAQPAPGIDPSSHIHESVQLGTGVFIGPNVVLSAGVWVGNDVCIMANTVIGVDCKIGDGCRLEPNVVLYHQVEMGRHCLLHAGTVLGSDGFGFAPENKQWVKIEQLGRVILADGVEIGANCTIDRGALADTLIGEGVKIDNLVHIAHNCQIGEHSAIAAQTGMAGSTKIGRYCTLGGQTGFAGHMEICDDSHFTGQAMVTKGISTPGVYSSGLPAQANKDWRKAVARFNRLEQLEQRLKQLEELLQEKSNGCKT